MTEPQNDIFKPIKELFDLANLKGGIEYIYTLLRVTGITRNRDPLLEVYDALNLDITKASYEQLRSHYCLLVSVEEAFALIQNLISCSQGKPYNPHNFRHLWSGEFPNITKPSALQISQEVIKTAISAGLKDLSKLIEVTYQEQALSECVNPTGNLKILQTAVNRVRAFLDAVLKTYFEERLKFKERPHLYKRPGFEILELLTDEKLGLYGLRMYFSNGESAEFMRLPDSTSCLNVIPTTPVNFMAGDLDKLKHEWRIGEKRLYEVGLQGRYNKWGEWKPIIYPHPDALIHDAESLSKDDGIQGAFFYMMCTGYKGIEFVARISVELPEQTVSFGEKFHLWKCPQRDPQNHWIYDGWLELDGTTANDVESAIATIGVALNRLAFAYGAVVDWRLKYRMALNEKGCAKPSKGDLQLLDSMLRKFPKAEENAIVLEAAIDWYNRGTSSRNPFTKFMCYYIALESIVNAISKGDADFGLGFHQEAKVERERKRAACIEEKFSALYSANPTQFVIEAYVDCVQGIKEKTRQVTELVFGEKHPFLQLLFEKAKDGYSLNDIRNKLAHGGISLIDRTHEELVRSRLHEIDTIAKEFIARLMFVLKPQEALPSWSELHMIAAHVADPRNCLVATSEEALPASTDWQIRPEWCD